MITNWVTRLIISVGIFLVGYALYRLVQYLQLRKAASDAVVPPGFMYGKTAAVVFSSPDCSVCKTVLLPTLNALKQMPEIDIQVIELDVTQHTGISKAWGIMSVPTLYILDQNGEPKFVNHGVMPQNRLYETILRIQGETSSSYVSRKMCSR